MTSRSAENHPLNFAGPGVPVDAAAVVVTYNSASDIAALIDDLRCANRERRLRLIVVDNDSSDDTCDIVRLHSDIELIESAGNLGYAGGINAALRLTEPCSAVLVLNPDLRLMPHAIDRMFDALADRAVGVVVPRILDEEGATYPSLRHEPSIIRMVGDAFCGGKLWLSRPAALSEFDYRPASYEYAHDVDWATGAALLIRADVARGVGRWNEDFFLYSEEIDYLRRVRRSGFRVRYEPSAVVRHRLGGSGSSPALAALMAVNRVRYAELHHGVLYSTGFRSAVALSEILRSYSPAHRRTLAYIVDRSRWDQLPTATKDSQVETISGERGRGAVIVPAYNEAAVIEQTLAPLSRAAIDGFIELIVVCNGCTDGTAERARRIPGAQVTELTVGSKPLALNTGDDTATLWPRLYLDADIQITAAAVLAVLDRLSFGDVLAARPEFRYGTEGASALVRSYYRARTRTSLHRHALWWAGVYGLTQAGHERFGRFPEVTGDDLFVDTQFGPHEKAVVATQPSVWTTPTNIAGLLTVLTRHHRGNVELALNSGQAPRSGMAMARAIVRTIRGPRSAADAAVYLTVAVMSRWRARSGGVAWERDDSSRSAQRWSDASAC